MPILKTSNGSNLSADVAPGWTDTGVGTRTGYIGVQHDTSTTTTSMQSLGGSSGGARWQLTATPLNLYPGTYTFTSLKFLGYSASAATAFAQVYFVVWSRSSNTFTSVLSAQCALPTTDGTKVHTCAITGGTVTLAAGTTYYWGFAVFNTASASGSPLLYHLADDQTDIPETSYTWRNYHSSSTMPSSVTYTGDGSLGSSVLSGGDAGEYAHAPPVAQVTFTTQNRITTNIGEYTGTAVNYLVDRHADYPYWILLRDVVVADGQALTVALKRKNVATLATEETLVVDCGTTNQITYGGKAAPLYLNGVSQTYDVAINIDDSDGIDKTDVFFVNKTFGSGPANLIGYGVGHVNGNDLDDEGDVTWVEHAYNTGYILTVNGQTRNITHNDDHHLTFDGAAIAEGDYDYTISGAAANLNRDICTRSVCAVNDAAHATSTTSLGVELNGPVTVLALSGTATVASIQVCTDLMVLMGDSQCGTKNTASAAAAVTRLGSYLPTAGTIDYAYWIAGIAGNYVSADAAGHSTSMANRFKNATPGKGDICDMRGIILAWCGAGVNDIIAGSDLYTYTAYILANLRTASAFNQGLVVAVHPIVDNSGSVYTAALAASVLRYNYFLNGLAMATKCAWYSPWALITANPTRYTATSDDVHYPSSGADTEMGEICGAAIAALVSGRASMGSGLSSV